MTKHEGETTSDAVGPPLDGRVSRHGEMRAYPISEVKHLYAKSALQAERIDELEAENGSLRTRLNSAETVLLQVGAVLSVAGRAMRQEVTAEQAVTAGLDCSPMRNIMSGMYGLTPLGGDKPKRKAKS